MKEVQKILCSATKYQRVQWVWKCMAHERQKLWTSTDYCRKQRTMTAGRILNLTEPKFIFLWMYMCRNYLGFFLCTLEGGWQAVWISNMYVQYDLKILLGVLSILFGNFLSAYLREDVRMWQ